MILARLGDRVVPPEHPCALWHPWERPAIHWLAGGHLAPFGRGRISPRVDRNLRGLGAR